MKKSELDDESKPQRRFDDHLSPERKWNPGRYEPRMRDWTAWEWFQNIELSVVCLFVVVAIATHCGLND